MLSTNIIIILHFCRWGYWASRESVTGHRFTVSKQQTRDSSPRHHFQSCIYSYYSIVPKDCFCIKRALLPELYLRFPILKVAVPLLFLWAQAHSQKPTQTGWSSHLTQFFIGIFVSPAAHLTEFTCCFSVSKALMEYLLLSGSIIGKGIQRE